MRTPRSINRLLGVEVLTTEFAETRHRNRGLPVIASHKMSQGAYQMGNVPVRLARVEAVQNNIWWVMLTLT